MQTKLTLRMDQRLIKRAKSYAAKRGYSLSKLVADYLAALNDRECRPIATEEMPPKTSSLRGMFAGAEIDDSDYREYLDEKHS